MNKFEKQNIEWNIVECEADRIYAQPAQGELSSMVQSDMKQWALKKGLWGTDEPYNDMIVLFAIDRGWLQENFSGMETL
jgi:hypothetical protein